MKRPGFSDQRIYSCRLEAEAKDEIISRNNEMIKKNALLLSEFIERHSNMFAFIPPKGATMAYVRLLNGRGAMDFCMEILEHTGVLIVPSSVLEESDEFLRIGLCRESFPECIRLVDEYLSSVS